MAGARQHPRYAIEADLLVDTGTQQLRSSSSNISRGGMCAELTAPVRPGQTVKLTLALPIETAPNPLQLTARAVWCTRLDERYQVGFIFGSLRREELAVIDLYLRTLEHVARSSGAA